ncbi:uncharacterized protein LOC127733348 [Mytilus californianus]|uniref:uncharacterized protein LOC127733348 n=1 Tax=Mytilus californianus TaxID=6549 RepID=UPI00224766F3|nr:uncharacterized protein LOC127733348 [Mytilus californianus]
MAWSLTYQYFDNLDLDITSTDRTSTQNDIFEIASDVVGTDEDSDMLSWKESNLCDSHLSSIQQRRQSHSMSNVLDLNSDNISMTDWRSTYPPSRSKLNNSPWFILIPSSKKYKENRKKRRNQITDSIGDQISSTDSLGTSSNQELITKPSEGDATDNVDKFIETNKKCPLCAIK